MSSSSSSSFFFFSFFFFLSFFCLGKKNGKNVLGNDVVNKNPIVKNRQITHRKETSICDKKANGSTALLHVGIGSLKKRSRQNRMEIYIRVLLMYYE